MLVTSANVTLDTLQNRLFGTSTMGFAGLFYHIFHETLLTKILVYGVIVFVQQQRDSLRRAREKEREAVELSARLSAARLETLEAQIRPHFLFNTLHTVTGLVEVDPVKARQVLSELGGLLRRSLDAKTHQEIPLSEELEVVHAYLSIEKARYHDRLATTFDVSDDSRDCLLPAFMVQTLVENAVRHGIGPEIEGGEVRVSAHCRNGRLEIEVCDTGRGIDSGRPLKEGVGLTNTRSRLLTLYGKDHEFDLRNEPGGGLRVMIAVPKRTGVATKGDDRR